MKRFKGFFLFLVIMLLSLGVTSIAYARDRNGSGGRDNEVWGGPKLSYDGKTSGFGRDMGATIGLVSGASIGGIKAGSIGAAVGGRYGERFGGIFGDKLERYGNKIAHDKWNSKGSKGRSWRF